MARWISEIAASWKLDGDAARRGHTEADRIHAVDRQLADPAGFPRVPAPQGLAGRVMESIATSGLPAAGQIRPRRQGLAIAAAACLFIGIGAAFWLRPAAPGLTVGTGSVAAFNLPVGPQPVMRMVSGTFDQPLRDETAKMVSDTRRATRAIVQCVPFTRRGG